MRRHCKTDWKHFFGFGAGILLFLAQPAPAQSSLDFQALDEAGSRVEVGEMELIFSEGQSIVGSVSAGSTDLDMGFVPALLTAPPARVLLLPPATISGSPVSPSTIIWTWDLVVGATGYTVYSAQGPRLATVTENTFQSMVPAPNTGRRICVASSDQYGEGTKNCVSSPAFSFAEVPGQPQAVSASTDSIAWTWDASANSVGTYYELALSTDGFMSSAWAAIPIENLYTSTSAVTSGLLPGTRYWAMVRAANHAMALTESSPQGSIVTLAVPEMPSGGAVAIAVDGSGDIWEVISSSGPTPETSPQTLVKFDANRNLLAATRLTGAVDLGTWSIKFGPDGYAYALGGAADTVTGLWSLAVYVVTPDGASLDAVKVLADTQGRSSLAFDSEGNVWIAGALVNNWEIEGTAMALWKYDPYLDELNLTTTAVVGLGSLGTGVDLDADDNIWVVGLSSIPATPGSAKLALTLLKFDPTGTQVLAGPFLRQGFIRDPGDTFARVLVREAGLFIAASKINANGDADLAFLKYDLAGNPAFAKVWAGAAGFDDVPTRLDALSDGLIIGGSFNQVGAPSPAATAAVWKFSSDGDLLYAQTIPGYGKIHDLTVVGSSIWMATDSPYASPGPYLFTGGTDVAGTLSNLAAEPPPAPNWITAQANSSTTITWNWALVEGATGYTVYRSTAGPKQTSVTSTFFVLGNQTANVLRTRCVAAANEYGEGPMACAQAYTMAVVPGQPQAVAASSHAITWAWGASGNPTGTYYALFLSTDAFATHFSTPIPLSMLYTSTSATISGLALDTLYYARVRAANGNMIRTPFSAITSARTGLADDLIAPYLSLAPPDGSTVTTSALQIVASYSDEGRGVNLATFTLYLDSVDMSTQAAVLPSSAAFAALELAQGTHTISASISDLAGNPTSASATFLVDSLPPLTSLLVNGLAVSAADLVLVSTDSVGFSSADIGTGVRETVFSTDSSGAQVFQSTFSLALGTHTVSYQSVDRAGNLEALKTASLTVLSPSSGLAVVVDFDPATLNLKSNGQFVNATIEVSGPKSAADITPASLRVAAISDVPLASPIAPVAKPAAKLGDEDADGIPDLRLKFDRQALIAVLPVGEQLKITLRGSFADGTPFSGEGFIRTIMPGQAKAGHGCKVFHPASSANVELPDGALSHDADITVTKLSATPQAEEDKRKAFATLHRLKTHGKPYDFGPEGTQFSIPVLLTLPYDLEALGDADPRGLKLAYWNKQTNLWEPLESVVDTKARTVSAKTTHFSLYQVVGEQGTGGGMGTTGFTPQAADAEFRYVEAYAFPNPARGSQNVTIRTQVGLADQVDVNIYDLSGRLMDSGSATSAQILDDSNGKGPQYTFDLVWNTSGAGSGIYIYAITAKKAGASSIHKRGKVGVIK